VTRGVRFTAEAEHELDDAARWYEEQRAGLGLTLVDHVDVAVERLRRSPAIGSLIAGCEPFSVRRHGIGRFPYHLAYLMDDDDIVVLALAHDKRAPRYWVSRLH
jgi:plasmid stabilization system protein ParE